MENRFFIAFIFLLINFIWRSKVKDVMTVYHTISKPLVKSFSIMSAFVALIDWKHLKSKIIKQ